MFTDSLEMKLKLTVGNTDFDIPGANIKELELDLQPYGFTSMLSFWVSDEKIEDKLFPLFTKQDLVRVHLTVSPHFITQEPEPEPLILQGLVTDKDILTELTIENVQLKGDPVIYRHYRIVFADPAYVLWRQHFPCDLMTDKTVKDLFEAHRGINVTLAYDWDVLNKEFAINTLPLGVDDNTCSFYDFVIWFVHSNNGVFSYDTVTGKYTLSGDKPKPDLGKSVALDKLDVEGHRIEFPQTIRNTAAVLNSFSEKAKREDIEQNQAADGICHDRLVRFPIAADLEQCIGLEKKRLKPREHEIHLTFQKVPQLTYRPGCLFKFNGPGWSDRIYPHPNVYRVRNIRFDAKAVAAEITADHNMPYAGYNIDMTSQLELESEEWVCLPPFKPPVYPLYVEGKVVSEQGEDDAKTYQFYQNADTSLDEYRVAIPLWKNQQVVLPFEPIYHTGHFYFPSYKHARVLVALDFHSGRIERFLDWRPGARLPMDTQGNHILFGKKGDSETSVQHRYVDNKPEFNIKRTSENDTETIRMVEGNLILETKEEEKE